MGSPGCVLLPLESITLLIICAVSSTLFCNSNRATSAPNSSKFLFSDLGIVPFTRHPSENKLNWIPDSAPTTPRNYGIVNSALCPRTERRNRTRTEDQENKAPLSESADPGANWMQDPRRDQCKGKLPSGEPLCKTSRYATHPKDEEGYTPGSRENRLYEMLIGHTGSHTQEPIKLIM